MSDPHQAVTVVVCDGHRCSALQARTDTGVPTGETATLLGALRDRVRRSRFAVLIRSGCLGVCEQAPAVLLVPRSSGPPGNGMVFGPVERPAQVSNLLSAIPADGGGTSSTR